MFIKENGDEKKLQKKGSLPNGYLGLCLPNSGGRWYRRGKVKTDI